MRSRVAIRRQQKKAQSYFAPINKAPIRIKRTPQQLDALKQLFGVSKH